VIPPHCSGEGNPGESSIADTPPVIAREATGPPWREGRRRKQSIRPRERLDFFVAKAVITALVAGAHRTNRSLPCANASRLSRLPQAMTGQIVGLSFFLVGEGGSTPRPYFHGRPD
jgi:hypothetical protein